MPIYEFYCSDCNTIFNFYSSSVNTTKKPVCPKCKTKILTRQLSKFSISGCSDEIGKIDDLPFNELNMGKVVNKLSREMNNINEGDPREVTNFLRKFSSISGLKLTPGYQEVLDRIENGEDPDAIQTEMGDRLENDPFIFPEKRSKTGTSTYSTPTKDETLYDL